MKEVFRNRAAGILWSFFGFFVAGSVVVTYLVVRDGPPEGLSVAGAVCIVAVCWGCTVALAVLAAKQPFIHATIEPDGSVTLILRHGPKRQQKVFAATRVSPAELVVSQDSEGSPYFLARVSVAGQEPFNIAESHRRQVCIRECERFNAALRRVMLQIQVSEA